MCVGSGLMCLCFNYLCVYFIFLKGKFVVDLFLNLMEVVLLEIDRIIVDFYGDRFEGSFFKFVSWDC